MDDHPAVHDDDDFLRLDGDVVGIPLAVGPGQVEHGGGDVVDGAAAVLGGRVAVVVKHLDFEAAVDLVAGLGAQEDAAVRAFGEFEVCDGTNSIDGNQIPAGRKGAGYPCMGQPGRATDADGDGVFEPSPCYAWNNTFNGAKLEMSLRRWADPDQAERAKSSSSDSLLL